jgi:hypothetical protein
METELFTLAYFSRNTLQRCDDLPAEIEHILDAARRNNAARGITGALLYSDGCFGQVLEGPLLAVEAIFEKIELDRRHRDVKVLHFKSVDKRSFGGWSMAFAGTAHPGDLPLNIRDVLESPEKIQGAEAGQSLVSVLSDLIDKHDFHEA